MRLQRQKEVGELEERLREMEVKYTTETASLVAAKKCQEEEHRAQVETSSSPVGDVKRMVAADLLVL